MASAAVYFVDDRRLVVGPYGVASQPVVAQLLMPPLNSEQVYMLGPGRLSHDPRRVDRMREFLTTFITNKNEYPH